MKNHPHEPLILFDDVCNLCNSSVLFIIKYDTNSQFKFASLQSDAAKRVLLHNKEETFKLNSIVLIKDGKRFDKSTAILQIFSVLGGIFHLTKIFYIIPKSIRDHLYNFIARKRYKWFGKRAKCSIPSARLKSRFID